MAQGGGLKHIAAYAAVVVLGGTLGGYAIYEHHTAQNLATDNARATAALDATQHQLSDLSAKVSMLASRSEAPTAPAAPSTHAVVGVGHRASAGAGHRLDDPRYKRLQSELDAQGKAIEQTRDDLQSTRGDLTNTRTELTGSIARTHDELVVLEKTGERNYFEFDLGRSKEFKREGPISISLRKADAKHGYANMMLLVDDRNLSQKHVNLYQPAMFYQPDTRQPIEIVINDISKDHIHGYVSAPKYRHSELVAMANANANGATGAQQAGSQNAGQGDNDIVGSSSASGADQANSNAQPVLKQRPRVPNSQPNR
jgi:hypothetical protein